MASTTTGIIEAIAEGSGSEGRAALNRMKKRLFKLVSQGATSQQWAQWLRVPLEYALAEGDKDLALSLLKAGADKGAGWKGCGQGSLLYAATEGGIAEMVSYLLLEKEALNELDAISFHDGPKNMTALHSAITGGHTAAARVLMLAGANMRLRDTRKRSALH